MLSVLFAFVALATLPVRKAYAATLPIRQGAARLWLDGVHLGDVQFGEHSVTLGDLITMDTQAPSAKGQIGMDTATGLIQVYDTAARAVALDNEVVKLAGSTMTGALVLGADLNANSNKITGLTDGGSGTQDAASVAQVEGLVAGATQGLFWKEAADYFCELSGLPAYTNGGSTLTADANGAFPAQDGETPAGGEFYLAAEFGASNIDAGLYELTQLGDGSNPWILTRRDDFAVGDEVQGVVTTINGGSTYAERSYRISNDADAATVGTDALAWAPFGKSIDHGNVLGLGDDDHTQYVMLAGRSGGTSMVGGTDSADDLKLSSTSHATKGKIIFADGNAMIFEGDDKMEPATDGEGVIGSASKRFKEVRAVNVYTGDLNLHHPTNGAKYRIEERRDNELAVEAQHSGEDLAIVMVRRGSIAHRALRFLG